MARVLAGAFKLPWEQRKPLARAVFVPLLAVIGVSLIGEFDLIALPETLDWLWVVIYCVPAAWLAVYIHRFLLRDLSDAHTGAKSGNVKRVVLYGLLGLAFWALLIGATLFGTRDVPAENSPDIEESMAQMVQTVVILFVSAVISALIGGRLCLALPAIAVDADVRAAVHAARGNTLRLTVVFALLPIAMSLLIELLFRENAGFLDLTLLVVLGAIVMVVEVAALSLSYRELTQPAPPPTDPPA